MNITIMLNIFLILLLCLNQEVGNQVLSVLGISHANIDHFILRDQCLRILKLENPQALIPENKMVYVGMRNPKDREDLIAYLLIETQ